MMNRNQYISYKNTTIEKIVLPLSDVFSGLFISCGEKTFAKKDTSSQFLLASIS